MTLLACRGLARRPWFEGFDLDLRAGEVVVLRGPSGSGKTLLLRALADLDPVDAGSVTLDGAERDTMSGPDWRAGVLYVHQRGPRLPGTVRENLDRVTGLVRHRGAPLIPTPEGLEDDQDAGRLSGGEGQVLALTRALACQPRVLLLDESTSALDDAGRRRWEARLAAWVKDGRAILWVAHDPDLATRVGARIVAFGAASSPESAS